MTEYRYPIVELAFWSPGDPGSTRVDALLRDPTVPLAKHGLTGIADAYARERGIELHAEHRAAADHVAMKTLAVDGALTEVVPGLRNAGLRFFVAKGPAVAAVAYPDPQLRPYTDLDVYVPANLLGDARAALADIGYAPVAQVPGPLGGVSREVHGGGFGAVVEVHGDAIDNFHRRHLPPIAAYVDHIVASDVRGLSVPVLDGAAHLALQAIHLVAGHRYQRAVLLRDIDVFLQFFDRDVARELGAEHYLDCIVGLLRAMRSEATDEPFSAGVPQRVLAAVLASSDPRFWNEYGVSLRNALALIVERGAAHRLDALMAAGRALVAPRTGRFAAQ